MKKNKPLLARLLARVSPTRNQADTTVWIDMTYDVDIDSVRECFNILKLFDEGGLTLYEIDMGIKKLQDLIKDYYQLESIMKDFRRTIKEEK